MTDPQVGDVLGGKYEVEGILGRGGMGVVVSARHMDLGQKVAIKCLLPHALAIPDVVERFSREARAAVQIQGEHVARVIDVGRFEDGTPYMVMEHLRGHDLADELTQRGPLSVPEAIRYLLETTEAIAQAHALRIVHRDLKPANLFLAETPGRPPIVKVLDFGISKVVDPTSHSLTKTTSIMGTPFYMSPEQLLSSKKVDERTDIWSLGVILFELLAGKPPFVAETIPEIVALILQNEPVPLRAYRADVPQGLEAVIGRCMQTKADDRYPNVAELAFALAEHSEPTGRDSAIAIARVLGALPPSSIQLGGTSLGNASTMPAPAPLVAGAASPARSSRPPASATAHNLTLSAPGAPPSPNRWPLVVGAALAAGAIGLGGMFALRSSSSKAAAMPSTTAAALDEHTATPPASASPPPTPASTPTTATLAPLPTEGSSPAGSAPSAGLAGGHGMPRVQRPAASPPPPRSSAAGAPSAPPNTPSRNPLDLQLKQ